MFYIYFKLDNRKQLAGLYPEEMEEILSCAEAILHEAGGSQFGRDEEIFRFAALYKETALNVLDCAVRLKAYLDEKQDLLYGYTVILSAEHDGEDLNIHFHNLSLLAEEENGIWMEGAAASRYGSFIEQESGADSDMLVPVRIKTEKMLFLEDLYRNFLVRPDLTAPVKREINEWLYREDQPRGLFVLAHDRDEALLVLEEVLEDDRALLEQYLLFEPTRDYWDVYHPLVQFINEDFLEHLAAYLSSQDQILWSQDGPFLQRVCRSDWYMQCSDQFYSEFLKAFSLYWSACLKKLDTYPTPPVLIIREPESFAEESLILLRDLLDHLMEQHPGQKYILLSEKEAVPGIFQDQTLRRLEIREAEGDAVLEKVKEAFPDCTLPAEEILESYDRWGRSLSSLFFHYWNCSEKHYGGRDETPEWVFLKNQDPVSLEILYICLHSRFFLTKELLLEFFALRRHIPEPEIEERLKRLETLSFVRFFSGRQGLSGRLEMLEQLEARESIKRDLLNRDYSQFLRECSERGALTSLSGLFSYLNKVGDIPFGLLVLTRIVNHLLDLREIDLAEALLESALFPGRELTNSQQEGLHNIRSAGRLRSALLRRDKKETERKMSTGYLSLMQPQGDYAEELLLQQAHYHAVYGDSDTALDVVKKSLFDFQKNSDHSGETRSNIGLALILLSQRKVQASLDYFEIAMRIGEQLEDKISGLFSRRFMTLASYLFGNLSMALRLLDNQIPRVEKERNRETQIFLFFLKGRILFELGRYSESFKILKQAMRLGQAYDLNDRIGVIAAWIGRALCFGYSEKVALEMLGKQPETLETAYFKAEAYYMKGNPAKGAEILQKAVKRYDKSREFLFEVNCWEDGFRLIEGHLSDKSFYEDVLYDQALGFYYFLLGKSGRKKEALEGLKPLCRMDTAYNQQPFGYYFFFYAQNLMEEEKDLQDENPMILLSHAFKLLQTRAGRFDNQQMKHSFFRKNYWNNEIVKKAQDLNFI